MKRGLYLFGLSNHILATDDLVNWDTVFYIDPATIDNNNSEFKFIASAIDEATGTIVAANQHNKSGATYYSKHGVWVSQDWGDTWARVDDTDVDSPESGGSINRGPISFGNGMFFSQDMQYSPFQYQGIKTSTDGLNWTDTGYTSMWTSLWNMCGLAYIGSRWVASGVANSSARGLISSADGGNTWSDASGVTSGNDDFALIPAGSYLFAISNYSTGDVYRTSDGHTWTLVASCGSGSWAVMDSLMGAVFDGTNIWIYGYSTVDPYFHVAKSSDNGATWTLYPLVFPVEFNGFRSFYDNSGDIGINNSRNIAYANGVFVGISYNAYSLYASSDGITWVLMLEDASVLVPYGNIHSIHMTDAFCAEFATLPQSNSFSSIADTERSYGATGQGYGLVPATVNNPNFGVGYKVTAGVNGAVVRVDSIKIRLKYQLDVTQEQLESVRPQGYASVAIGRGSQVIVGAGGLILRSTDNGQNWSPVTAPIQADFRKVVYEKNTYVATGSNGVIIKSTDEGVSWTAIDAGISSTIRSIAYHPSTGFVMSGKDGLSVSSKLLISWRFI